MTKTTQGLSPSLILLMSIATGLAVASNYYAQPLLDTIARNFSLSASTAGFIVTAAQLGYAAGLLFLVPLGDMFERRMLIVSMTLLAAGGMLITASSQSLGMLILGTCRDRTVLGSGTDFGSAGGNACHTGQAREGCRHDYERPAAGYSAGAHRGGIAGESWRLAHRILGRISINGADGGCAVARPAENEIRYSS